MGPLKACSDPVTGKPMHTAVLVGMSVVVGAWLVAQLDSGSSLRPTVVSASATTAVSSSHSDDAFTFVYTHRQGGTATRASGVVNLQEGASEGTRTIGRSGPQNYVAIGTKAWWSADKTSNRWLYNPDLSGAWISEDGSIDPFNYIQQLRDASWDVTQVHGSRPKVGGVVTTLYRADGNVDDEYGVATVVEHLTLEMWVDGSGMLRRLDQVGTVQGDSSERRALNFYSETTFYKVRHLATIQAPAAREVEPPCPATKPNTFVRTVTKGCTP